MNTYYSDGVQFLIEEHTGHSIYTIQHFHKVFELYHLVQGEVSFFIDDTIYAIKKGDIVIIPPNTIHKTVDNGAKTRKRHLIYLDPSFVTEFQKYNLQFWNSPSIFHISDSERISHIFNELLAEYQSCQNEVLLKALTCELIVLLQRKKEGGDKLIETSPLAKRISDVVSYINSKYSSDITLESTAQHFTMSEGHLSRLFKENTGLSFCDYMRKYRVKKAVELMADPDKNITDIAFDVGFNSTNHFCKTFKAIMNESPLKYKKRHFKKGI